MTGPEKIGSPSCPMSVTLKRSSRSWFSKWMVTSCPARSASPALVQSAVQRRAHVDHRRASPAISQTTTPTTYGTKNIQNTARREPMPRSRPGRPLACSGTRPVTCVPRLGADVTVERAAERGDPVDHVAEPGSGPALGRGRSPSRRRAPRRRDGRPPRRAGPTTLAPGRVLRRVVQRLEAREVDGGLDLDRIAAHAIVLDADMDAGLASWRRSAAARPCAVSTGGWMPCARSLKRLERLA